MVVLLAIVIWCWNGLSLVGVIMIVGIVWDKIWWYCIKLGVVFNLVGRLIILLELFFSLIFGLIVGLIFLWSIVLVINWFLFDDG